MYTYVIKSENSLAKNLINVEEKVYEKWFLTENVINGKKGKKSPLFSTLREILARSSRFFVGELPLEFC